MSKNKNSDLYHPIALFGWFILFLALAQTVFLPVPVLYIFSAVVWIIAVLVKRWETADPDYIPLEETPVSADLEKASYAVMFAAVFPVFVWIGWFFIVTPGASVLLPGAGFVISAVSFVIVILMSLPLMALMGFTAYLMKRMNYGNPVL